MTEDDTFKALKKADYYHVLGLWEKSFQPNDPSIEIQMLEAGWSWQEFIFEYHKRALNNS